MPAPPGEDTHFQDRPDADLRRLLSGLVDESSRDGGRLDRELRALAESYEGRVYQELIQQLTSLELNREEGAGYWQAVVSHQDELEQRLGKSVDVRVAMLDWLLEARAMKAPRIVELAKFEKLEASVHRDGLTGLYNFRFFEEHLRRMVARSARLSAPLSLAMIDVDHFKAYNDRHGHEAGNQALIAVSRVLAKSLRQNDVCARYGGEEFVIVFADTAKTAAQEAAERTRHEVVERAEEISGIGLVEVPTISVGIATYPADAVEAPELIANADAALYMAKAAGRNQVRVYGDLSRSFRRADLRFEGSFRTLESTRERFRTSSLGEGGFSMRIGRQLPTASLVEALIEVPGHKGRFTVIGRVVYSRPVDSGDFDTGLQITEMEASDRTKLAQLLENSEEPGGPNGAPDGEAA